MRSTRAGVALALALASSLLVAGRAQGQYRFDTWTTEEGLPQNGDGTFVLPETIDPDAEVITVTGPDGASWTVTPQQVVERRGSRTTNQGRRRGLVSRQSGRPQLHSFVT